MKVGWMTENCNHPVIHPTFSGQCGCFKGFYQFYSPVGLLPKQERGQQKQSMHLSHPQDNSINSGNPKNVASIQCKPDLTPTFRHLPIHSDDSTFWPLLVTTPLCEHLPSCLGGDVICSTWEVYDFPSVVIRAEWASILHIITCILLQ